ERDRSETIYCEPNENRLRSIAKQKGDPIAMYHAALGEPDGVPIDELCYIAERPRVALEEEPRRRGGVCGAPGQELWDRLGKRAWHTERISQEVRKIGRFLILILVLTKVLPNQPTLKRAAGAQGTRRHTRRVSWGRRPRCGAAPLPS